MAKQQPVSSGQPTLVVLVTGHPATGKTTFAHYLSQELFLPLLWRDQIKETLLDMLEPPAGENMTAWSRRLGVVSWNLFYHQVETLLQAGVPHVVESNFDPVYANSHWQALASTYPLRLVQVRCECELETLLARYRARIDNGERHSGHVDDSENPAFLAKISDGPVDWVAVPGERVVVETTNVAPAAYGEVARTVAAQL